MSDAAEETQPIQMDVKVESPQPCLREVVVTIPNAEVQRYMKNAYDEILPDAQVPGFRAGRAPRRLVEKQFKDQVVDRVKGSLLMDSLSQVTESQDFSAISEPDFDYNSIVLPDEGDFKFQFSVEVRPEFDTPNWKGLEFSRPVEQISDDEVTDSLNRVLSRYATLEATDEAAEMGDRLLITAKFTDGDKTLTTMDEERVTLEETLSFSDARCDDFGKLMKGVTEGETRQGKVKISDTASDEAYAGKEVDAEFSVVEVYKFENPQLTPEFLEELGDFESESELNDFIRDSLQRQADYREQQVVREKVVELLAGSANFELPETLVRRQTNRELERKVLELRRNGFDEDNIRRFVNSSRQNAQSSTESALREHFILEQIAEELEIDASPEDYDAEIELIAQQSDMPTRRVRARLEKQGQMDALRNQIVERKVIEAIIAEAKITDEKVKPKKEDEKSEFAVYHSVLVTKNDDAIPEAKYDDSNLPGAEKEKEKDKDRESE
tara:strand:+ start:138710 stop:140200 length:1491 start_codon:yes stop_codon:yes gene_type:complete